MTSLLFALPVGFVFLLMTLLLPQATANPLVVPDSPIRLSLSRRLNLTSGHALYRHDFFRARTLKARRPERPELFRRAVIGTMAENEAVRYIAQVGVGSPPTSYSLVLDTGSSNTWIGAGQSYVTTATSVDTGDALEVNYGSGSFKGTHHVDTVTLGRGLVINNQSIGVASTAHGFKGVDGILGLGPQILTIDTLPASPETLIPTVTDNLFTSGTISSHSVGILFAPMNSHFTSNGGITWGGVDPFRTTEEITYVPITDTAPSKYYWGIDSGITYGFFPSQVILSKTAGIVDTGSTLLLIATDAFERYKTATGAIMDTDAGLLSISLLNLLMLQSLHCSIGDKMFHFTRNAQLWPRILNTNIGGRPNGIYLIVADLGSKSGDGLDFIYGQSWLERFYSVYDTANRRVGIANTPYTGFTSN